MKKTNLCILFGGVSTEHDISCLSASAIIRNADHSKYNILAVGITKEGRWLYAPDITSSMLPGDSWLSCTKTIPVTLSVDRTRHGLFSQDDGEFFPVDCVFPVLHGFNGEDGTMQGLLEISGIPYVGCDTISSAMSMDKAITKLIVDDIGVAQAKWHLLRSYDLQNADACISLVEKLFSYPLFVKPARTGSSVGVGKVNSRVDLIPALNEAARYDDKILVEEFIDAHEIEVAVLGNDNAIVSDCGEVVPTQEFYSFDAKYNDNSSKTKIPADLPSTINDEIRARALRIYNALGCSGLSRVDFFIKRSDLSIVFNEINTIPGFTAISMYPKLFEAHGLSFSELINHLVACAYDAHKKRRKYK